MVLYFTSSHTFKYDFQTVTLACFNRYPNPYSAHVKSVDTIEKRIDQDGRLHQTKLIMKSGRLPQFVKPFLGKITTSWIIERTIVDPIKKTMNSYTCNLDHRKIMRIEEYVTYQFNEEENVTHSKTIVKFSSGFKNTWNLRDRIETWSKNKFHENANSSRLGLKIVMDKVRERLYPVSQMA